MVTVIQSIESQISFKYASHKPRKKNTIGLLQFGWKSIKLILQIHTFVLTSYDMKYHTHTNTKKAHTKINTF